MTRPIVDRTGLRFGRLLVKERNGNIGSYAAWVCVCDCGALVRVSSNHLNDFRVIKSCGCYARERAKTLSRTTHGMTGTPEHRAWDGLKQRCLNPNNPEYPNYGGRGITVCDRWLHGFENFLADVGLRPTHRHSIDRVNNDRGYEPGNVRWATAAEQARNRRVAVTPQVASRALFLREAAMTFGDIGGLLGISGETARRLCREAGIP